MCIKPNKIADVGVVACRECWQCRETAVDDWVGRNIAEGKTAKAAHVVTLTYGEDQKIGGTDHVRAAVLTYSDVQKYLKYLRVEGYPVRYFAVGEYGTLKGRAHWHIILYWQDRVPPHQLRRNFNEKHWPHGHSYWDKMTPEAIRYACKYLQKDPADEEKQGYGPMMSKKPPLGDAYFKRLADRYVNEGLAPQSLHYQFPDVRRLPKGMRANTAKQLRESAKPVSFMMRGKTAENFLEYFVEAWRERYNDEPPASRSVWAYLDKTLKAYLESVSLPQFDRRGFVPVPDKPPHGGSKPIFDEKVNCHYSTVDGVRLWYSHDNEGELGWHEKIAPDARKQRQRELRQQQTREAYRVASGGW